MIRIEASTLRKGDRIQFTEKGKAYTIASTCTHSWEHSLLGIDFESDGPGGVTMPQDALVYAERMVRVVSVPCLVHKEDIRVLHDMACSPQPRAVICGSCDEKATAAVLAMMAEQKGSETA